MAKEKAAINLSNLDTSIFDGLPEDKKLASRGISHDKLMEPVPGFVKANCEKVIKGENNTWIVMGRDRVTHRASGYGSKGVTGCGSIDIVAGRMAPTPASIHPSNKKPVSVDPMPKESHDPAFGSVMDAARVMINQMTDVDTNFGLAPGRIGTPKENEAPRSAVVLQADGIRLIAREGVKIVTGVGAHNSQGGNNARIIKGIDLIAGNDDRELQPMVKGDSMIKAMEELTQLVDDITGVVDSFLTTQVEMNVALATHFHASPFFGAPTTQSPTVQIVGSKVIMDQMSRIKISLISQKANLARFKLDFLKPFGTQYINSKYNNVN